MKTQFPISVLIFLLIVTSCKPVSNLPKDDGKITVTFVQINDVYEFGPFKTEKLAALREFLP